MAPEASSARTAPASVGKSRGARRPITLYASASVKHDWSSSPIWFADLVTDALGKLLLGRLLVVDAVLEPLGHRVERARHDSDLVGAVHGGPRGQSPALRRAARTTAPTRRTMNRSLAMAAVTTMSRITMPAQSRLRRATDPPRRRLARDPDGDVGDWAGQAAERCEAWAGGAIEPGGLQCPLTLAAPDRPAHLFRATPADPPRLDSGQDKT